MDWGRGSFFCLILCMLFFPFFLVLLGGLGFMGFSLCFSFLRWMAHTKNSKYVSENTTRLGRTDEQKQQINIILIMEMFIEEDYAEVEFAY